MLPRNRLLEEQHGARWEFTEAEILAGLDSYFIGKHACEWVNQLRRIRLSQVLEMYFSPRGIPVRAIENSGHKSKTFENIKDYASMLEEMSLGFSSDEGVTSGCDRRKILESIDVARLKEDTFNFAQVLQFTATSIFMTEEKLKMSCDHAVNMFVYEAKKLLASLPQCIAIPKAPREITMNLMLAIDGSRSAYENLQLVNHIAHIGHVHSYGSHIQVIHGTSGEVIVNRTRSIVDTFDQMRNSSNSKTIGHNPPFYNI